MLCRKFELILFFNISLKLGQIKSLYNEYRDFYCEEILNFLFLKGSLMVAYVVYTLGKVSDRETCFKLLQSLPLFCSNFISTEMVTSTLLTLTKSPDILPTALRLLTKTWEKQDKILPYILRLLLPPVAGKVEWSISSAACLSDICRLRPEVHGEECIPYISQLLSYSKDPLMTALLISALTSLCSNSIVEPGLLWKLLGPQLSSRDR